MLLVGMEAAFAQDPFPIQGYTNGCISLGGPCIPPNNSSAPETIVGPGGLTWRNSTFNSTTSTIAFPYLVSLGGNPSANVQNFNNLGSLEVGSTPFIYNPAFVTVRIEFTSPLIITGGPGCSSVVIVQGFISGEVGGPDQGGISVDWMGNGPQQNFQPFTTCTFIDAAGQAGSIDFTMFDSAINPGHNNSIDGLLRFNFTTLNTVTPTGTTTATPTVTETPVLSSTPTATSTPTASSTLTITNTPTITTTPLVTSTVTQTPTASVTQTPNVTSTPTNIPQPNVVSSTASCRQVDNPNGTASWTNPAFAAPQDDPAFASNGMNGFQTEYILCDNLNLGQVLPPNATITGIEVLVNRRASAALRAKDASVRVVVPGPNPLIPDGSLSVVEKSGTDIPTAFTVAGFGGVGEQWGESWTVAELSDPDFGAVYAARRTSSNAVTVDVQSFRVRVFYTP
jgi:hypothetical protein